MNRIEPISRPMMPLGTDFHPPIYDTTPRRCEFHFECSRPILDPPGTKSAPFCTALSNFVDTLSSIESLYLDVIEGQMKDASAKYVQNFQKNLAQSRQLEEQEKGRTWWAFLQTIASYLLAASALVTGGVICRAARTNGEFAAGGAMVVSGVTGVLGATLNEMHMHPELAAILTTTSAAMGLMAGGSTLLFGGASRGDVTSKIVVAALGIVASSADVVKEGHAMKISDIKSRNALIQNVLEKQQVKMKMLSEDAAFFAEKTAANIELCAIAQREHEQSIRKIQLAKEYAG